MSQDPCRQQTPNGGRSQDETSTNPRQSRVNSIRDIVDEYDLTDVYNIDPPLPDTDDDTPDGDTGTGDESENGLPEGANLSDPNDTATIIGSTRELVSNLEGQKLDGNSFISFLFSTKKPEESLVFTKFNAPFRNTTEGEGIRTFVGNRLRREYEKSVNSTDGVSRIIRHNIQRNDGARLASYDVKYNPLRPGIDQPILQPTGPRHSPGYHLDMDTFRYVTGKFYAAVDKETADRFDDYPDRNLYGYENAQQKSIINEGVYLANNLNYEPIFKSFSFPFCGYHNSSRNSSGFGDLNVIKHVPGVLGPQIDSGDLISSLDVMQGLNKTPLDLALEETKEANLRAAAQDFPYSEGGKMEHFVMRSGPFSQTDNSALQNRDRNVRDDIRQRNLNPYRAYMMSGWSWRNYFNGFFPLNGKYTSISNFRENFGSRDKVLVETPFDYYNPMRGTTSTTGLDRTFLNDKQSIFIHPSVRMNITTLDATARSELELDLGGYDGLDLERGRDTSYDLSDFGGTPFHITYDPTIVDNSAPSLPQYNTNFFPVMPFYGVNTLIPDEITDASTLIDDYWGGKTVVDRISDANQLQSSQVGYDTVKGIFNLYFSQYRGVSDGVEGSYRPIYGSPDEDILLGDDTFGKTIFDLSPITSRYTKFATFERKTFKDHVAKIPTFATEYEFETKKERHSSYIYTKGEYNFFDPAYENFIGSDTETVDNSGYSSAAIRNKQNRDNKNVSSLIRYGVPKTLPDPYTFNPKNIEEKTSALLKGISENYSLSDVPIEELKNVDIFKQYDFLVPSQFLKVQQFGSRYIKSKEFKDIYLERKTFPMYTDIEIGMSGKSLFLDLLQSIEGTEQIFTLLAQQPERNAFTVVTSESSQADEEDLSVKVDTFGRAQYVTIEDWADTLSTYIAGNNIAAYEERLVQALSFITFKESMMDYCKKRARNYEQILRGDFAHCEVIGFRIDKYQLNSPVRPGSGLNIDTSNIGNIEETVESLGNYKVRQYLKSYYFAGTNSDDPTKFIDTQVEYGHAYQYDIHSICLIVGTEYAYLDTQSAKRDVEFNIFGAPNTIDNTVESYVGQLSVFGGEHSMYRKHHQPQEMNGGERIKLCFSVLSKPSPVISENYLRTMTVGILDKPPLPPNVEIVPLKDTANLVQFNLNSVTGEMFAKPVLLEPDDYDQYFLSAMNQGLDPNQVVGARGAYWGEPPSETELLHFKNDDQCLEFEVFRLSGTSKPTSWADFAGLKQLTPRFGATSTTFVDQLVPNVKYYYAFRATDVHGHTSLPSSVYEVELRKDQTNNGSPYLVQSVCRFPEKNVEAATKKATFKRLFQIKPSLLQTQVPNLIEDRYTFQKWKNSGKKLGISNNEIWGKTVLYRIKSKATGKMVEVRVKFNRKHGIVDGDGKVTYDD